MTKDQIRAMNADKGSTKVHMTSEMEKKLLDANKAEIDIIVQYGKGEMSLQDFEMKLTDAEKNRLNANINLYQNKEQKQ